MKHKTQNYRQDSLGMWHAVPLRQTRRDLIDGDRPPVVVSPAPVRRRSVSLFVAMMAASAAAVGIRGF